MRLTSLRSSGFALWELAVALVIVSLLALVLIPLVLPSPPDRIQQIHCLSNSKQIGAALMMYVQDYDERFPPVCSEDSKQHILQNWGGPYQVTKADKPLSVPGLVDSYLKNMQIFQCPRVLYTTRQKSVDTSYMYNDLAASTEAKEFTSPAVTVLVAEGELRTLNFGHAYTPDSGPIEPDLTRMPPARTNGGTVRSAPTRHKGFGIYVFADGHARSLQPEAVFFPARENGSPSHTSSRPDWEGPAPLVKKGASSEMRFHGQTYKATFHIR